MIKRFLNKFDCETYLSIGCLLFAHLTFNLLLINKFFPITEGWFQDYARYILEGQVAYRDFYCPIPPGFLWLSTAFFDFFGYSFINLRFYGVFERLIMITIVYLIIKRVYSNKLAFISVLTASIIYISNIQDVFYSYYQTSVLFALLALYFCIKMVENPGRALYKYAIFFGFFSGVSFIIKQNIGALLPITIGICVFILIYRQNPKEVIKAGILSFVTAMLVLICSGLYLYYNGAFYYFIDQVFGGAVSKGSFTNIFFGFFSRMVSSHSLKRFFAILIWFIAFYYCSKTKSTSNKKSTFIHFILSSVCALIPLVFIYQYFSLGKFIKKTYSALNLMEFSIMIVLLLSIIFLLSNFLKENTQKRKNIFYYLIMGVGCFLMFSYINNHSFDYIDYMEVRNQRQFIIYALFYLLLIWICKLFLEIRKKNTVTLRVKLLLVVASWVFMYVHGMSGIVEDHGTLLMFSIVLAEILDVTMPFNTYKNALILFFCIGNILIINVQRCSFPYHWWGVGISPSLYSANFTYKDPYLKGILGEKKIVNEMNRMYDLLNSNKKHGDTLYSFPHINYFNVMTGLDSPTFAKVHYFDVCPDKVAVNDAELLIEKLPTFIVWQELSENEWELHENLFRNGNKSGQRHLKLAVEKLFDTRYVFLGKFIFNESDPVYVYGLNDGRNWEN